MSMTKEILTVFSSYPAIYNATNDTVFSDMVATTNPLGIARLVNKTILHGMAAAEPERFDRLEAAGFRLIRYGDIISQLFEKFGGHYMDVGASAKIADGLVSLLWQPDGPPRWHRFPKTLLLTVNRSR